VSKTLVQPKTRITSAAKNPTKARRPPQSPTAVATATAPGVALAPIVLHGCLEAGRFLLWAEMRVESGQGRATRSGKGQNEAATSPYDPGRTRLIEVVRTAPLATASARAETIALWLPSLAGGPVASSGLVADPPMSSEPAMLRAWAVTAVALPWSDVVEFLCACRGRRTLAPGVIVGDDLEYWAAAMRLAGGMVARQHFLPDIVEEKGELLARWRPAPTYADSQSMAQLAATMPDACRAAGNFQSLPANAPAEVLSGFLMGVVDHLVRSGQAGPPAIAPDSPDAQWLIALARDNPRIDGERAKLGELRERVRAWWRPLAISAASPFRLCLRLEEPEAIVTDTAENQLYDSAIEDRPWHLRYLLQANYDPSLMVTASHAWSARGREAEQLRRDGFDVREFLLRSLAEAARICAPIEDSLRGGIPDAHELDATGAARFLTEEAAALEQAGFGIVLPASWSSKGTKVRLATRAKIKSPKMSSMAGLSLFDLVDIDWEAAIGDQTLSRQELNALARLKTPLVRMRGQWVLLNSQEIQEAIARLQRGTRKITAREALAIALGSEGGDGAGGGPARAQGWFNELLQGLSARERIGDVAPPEGFSGSLRPYQERGFAWLEFLRRWGLGACLADDMGLGKTVQTLVHILNQRQGAGAGPVLLVCPTSVISNWEHETARFTPALRVMVHHGSARARGGENLAAALSNHDLVLTSYSLLQRDVAALEQIPWSAVVLDEAQNIKNPESKQARAACAIKSAHRIALTGTPVENHVGDLWSLMEFLNPGMLGNRAEFKRRYLVPIQAGNNKEAAARLRALTGPFILRRLKTDKNIIGDLPDKLEMTVYCTLTREQASLYAAVVDELMPELEKAEGIQRKGMVLAALSRLKQVCNHPAQFLGDNSAIEGRSGKLARLSEMLEEVIESGERALIFSQFAEMGDIIRRHLESLFGREVLFLHGGVAKTHRDRMVARFQEADPRGPAVFVLSLKAGGTGLNLTAANHVFHYDRWWNPAVENQATDRAFRIGQRRNVFVHKFLCSGTLEEKIDAIIEKKKALAQSVVGTGEDWLTKLSTAELRDLFALRADVAE
jgi:SNF2 family DNA or RNA helicase